MKLIIATTMATTLALTPLLAQEKEPGKRLDDAAAVFSEIKSRRQAARAADPVFK